MKQEYSTLPTGGPVLEDTMQDVLARHIGHYVSCELLVGTQDTTLREGVLDEVGSGYFLLRDEHNGVQTSCDLYALKFVTFLPKGVRPSYRYHSLGGMHAYDPIAIARIPMERLWQ